MKQHRARWAMLAGIVALAGLAASSARAADEFERIREKAAEMLVSLNDGAYATFADGKNSALQRTYGDYGYLLTPSKLDDLKKLVDQAGDPAERQRRETTTRLLRYHAMRASAAPVIDNALNTMRDKGIAVEEGRVVLRGLNYRLGREANQDVRRKWTLASSELYASINVYLKNLMLDMDTQARKLGYEGYYEFLREAEAWDVALLEAAAESLLTSTQASYAAALDRWALKELDLPTRRMRSFDAPRLLFFPGLSRSVKGPAPEAVADKALADVGIQLSGQRNLRLDLKDRAGREPEARAYALNSGRTRVAMTPSGYVTDVQDLLGAYGEAQFYYSIPGNTPFESAYFGTNILPSIYRELFAGLATEPAWVARHLKLDGVGAEEVAEAMRFRSLLRAREAAGRLLFQLELHANPSIEPGRYNQVMERALIWPRISVDAEAYLLANDDYRSGGLVLGAMIAAQIRDALRREWGEEWFRRPELAKRLEQGASRGYAMTIDEFLKIWKLDGIHMEPLLAEYHREGSGS